MSRVPLSSGDLDLPPFPLDEALFEQLRGLGDTVSFDQARRVYGSLARLLYQRIRGRGAVRRSPFVLSITGSVAVGKSTAARLLSFLLSSRPYNLRSVLVPTDGFIFPLTVLRERDLLHKKGFPESFDNAGFINFLLALKRGQSLLRVPVYSHVLYDIVPGAFIDIQNPDVVLLEGLNILPSAGLFLDFSIYIHAEEKNIETWFTDRLLMLRKSMEDPKSYFHSYAHFTDSEMRVLAWEVWHGINLPNLRENIVLAKDLSDLIIEKGANHLVSSVLMNRGR